MKYFKFLVFIVLTITIIGCKETFNLGNDTLKDDEILNAQISDTVTLNLTTIKSFPVITTGGEYFTNFAPHLIIGNSIDPVFNKTNASFLAELRQLTYGNFGDSAILDSIYLLLPIKFGDSVYATNNAEILNLSVYKLNDTLNHYLYNNQLPQEYYNPSDLIGQGQTELTKKAQNGDKGYDTIILSLRLNNSFGNYLLDNAEELFASSNAYFHRKFFGIYVKSDNNNSGLYKIQVNDATNLEYSGIVMYYHFPSNPSNKLSFHLPITAKSARVNLFTHDHTATPFYTQLIDSTIILDKAYLQSMAGTYVKVSMNGLKNLKNVVIHKAELILNIEQTEILTYKPNNYLWLAGLDSTKSYLKFIDFFNNSSYVGVPYKNGQYRFIITRIVQSIIDGKYDIDKNGLYIFDINTNQNFNRVIINNGNSGLLRSKLVLTYTKID